MRKLVTVALIFVVILFAKIGFEQIEMNSSSNIILGFDGNDAPDIIHLGFDGNDAPDIIHLGFDGNDAPDIIHLGFDGNDAPDII
ncbi:MAG: hypothetical protein Q7I99_05015, partial [Acholeplasmataceae bacterium]|nr:hypothetical protein [Acholeplasmataceae bacterium]